MTVTFSMWWFWGLRSGLTSYETIPPIRLETSVGVLTTVDMVVQRRDGPRRLREHDDDDDFLGVFGGGGANVRWRQQAGACRRRGWKMSGRLLVCGTWVMSWFHGASRRRRRLCRAAEDQLVYLYLAEACQTLTTPIRRASRPSPIAN